MQELYPYFIKIHVLFSIAFLLTAIFITIYSFVGWYKNFSYGTFANHLRNLFLGLLLMDLLLGIILYFFLKKPFEVMGPEQAMRLSNLRFWAIQHFSNMMFVVILSVIGNLFINRISQDSKKHKYSFLYFGMSTIIMIVSVGLFELRK